MRLFGLALACASCSSPAEVPDAALEIPAAPMTCGAGNGGEIMGSLQHLDGSPVDVPAPTPGWQAYVGPGGSDGPSGLVLVPGEQRFVLYVPSSGNRMQPLVGEYQTSANAFLIGGGAHVIVDESDVASNCLAGRFDASFNNYGTGHLVGWFRTR